ncbi:hypothetical protein F4V57_10975 [Acinetobacter qingfengensis]|uniref:Lipoprotein n=1 Tax=Acinetobacter qingfengensis TaxID=1262585 RepID=A0A1E7RCX3_9GAMM|nr:hypothetical protein [Acinetobacter qingfengensis]KAA8732135.1 hypothetical protein F4V57_10975 [Acinetobacter qingfengensis]OEY97214.1 hypothetical protein BJI46_01960 [Acinetobacter qingfengensis]
MTYNKCFSLTTIFVTTLLLAACGEKKTLTAEEQWQNFCKSYEGAAFNIMYDRQNDISKAQSIEHLKKSPEGKQRDMLMVLVDQAHQVQKYDQQKEKDLAMEQFKAGKYQQCLNTAH